MRSIRLCGLASVLLVTLAAVQAHPSQPQNGNLKEGDVAPNFTIKDVEGKKTVKLADLKGQPVVLIFGSCT
jgi:cytochrome oxidase Cu insertion factor (SCO1/SenC/PrrC family)